MMLQKWWVRLILSFLLGSFMMQMIQLRTDLIAPSLSTLLILVFALIIFFCSTFFFSMFNKMNPRKLNLKKDEKHKER